MIQPNRVGQRRQIADGLLGEHECCQVDSSVQPAQIGHRAALGQPQFQQHPHLRGGDRRGRGEAQGGRHRVAQLRIRNVHQPWRFRGEIGQVAGVAAAQQAHHQERLVRGHVQPPLAAPVAQRAVHALAGLQRAGGEGSRGPRAQHRGRAAARRSAVVVYPADGCGCRLRTQIDHAQEARLPPVAARVERGHAVHPARWLHHVVHGGEEAVGGAHVGERLEIEGFDLKVLGVKRRGELQPPVARAVANAFGQALGGVAVLQVPRVEVDGLAGVDGQRHRAVAHAGVVNGH